VGLEGLLGQSSSSSAANTDGRMLTLAEMPGGSLLTPGCGAGGFGESARGTSPLSYPGVEMAAGWVETVPVGSILVYSSKTS
jgi:hypothetical protein